MITTTEITHATPAGFGGGKKYWLPSNEPGSVRTDNGLIDDTQEKGYTYVDNPSDLSSLNMDIEDKVLGLFNLSHMTYENSRGTTEPNLSTLVERALDLLEEDPDGFFLMVEGGRIDHAGHANDITNVVHETNFNNFSGVFVSYLIHNLSIEFICF